MAASETKPSAKSSGTRTKSTISLDEKEKQLIDAFADELGLSNSKAIVRAVQLASEMLHAQEKGEEIIFREPETQREQRLLLFHF